MRHSDIIAKIVKKKRMMRVVYERIDAKLMDSVRYAYINMSVIHICEVYPSHCQFQFPELYILIY